jgi:cell division protein ZapA
MSDKPSSVSVEIFGQTYLLRAGAEPGHVERIAAHVDAQMRQISQSGGAVDSVRIAVLASLNIADECLRLREALRDLDERAARLERVLAAAADE